VRSACHDKRISPPTTAERSSVALGRFDGCSSTLLSHPPTNAVKPLHERLSLLATEPATFDGVGCADDGEGAGIAKGSGVFGATPSGAVPSGAASAGAVPSGGADDSASDVGVTGAGGGAGVSSPYEQMVNKSNELSFIRPRTASD
jgi:hypothetical protein